MESDFCLEALERALRRERREIFNRDQGFQLTSEKFTNQVIARKSAISTQERHQYGYTRMLCGQHLDRKVLVLTQTRRGEHDCNGLADNKEQGSYLAGGRCPGRCPRTGGIYRF